jgi:glycosyltransferase involved in cell wall biosynthesis
MKAVMSSSLLSAIIPVRAMRGNLENLTRTLRLCSGLAIDVLIIHDDAQDGTSQELHKLVDGLGNSSISLVEKNVNSPGLARNIGISLTKTDWLCFWDSDDLPNPTAYLEMINASISNHAQVSIGGISSMDRHSGKIESTYAVDTSQKNWVLDLVNMPSFTRMAFERKMIGSIRFPSFRMGEDQCFLRDLNFLNYKIYTTAQTCYTYITNFDGQLTRNEIALADVRRSVDHLVSRLSEAEGKMIAFSQGQALKLFISGLRLPGRLNWIKKAPRTWLGIGLLCLQHPLRSAGTVKFLVKNRVRLAGR